MDGRLWKKCFSTWSVDAPEMALMSLTAGPCRNGKRHEPGTRTEPRRNADHPRADGDQRLPPPHRRFAEALHVSVAELGHPPARADLLAVPADADLGLLADLPGRDPKSCGASRGRSDRLGPAVGHSVPFEDRLLNDLHRGDVVAQCR